MNKLMSFFCITLVLSMSYITYDAMTQYGSLRGNIEKTIKGLNRIDH